jgi:hypothetical protein
VDVGFAVDVVEVGEDPGLELILGRDGTFALRITTKAATYSDLKAATITI